MSGIFDSLRGSRADPAAGRRHRLRFLDAAAEGRSGARVSAPMPRARSVLHGCLGRHVPHHHERRAARRGAMMATLACDHPDIEAFIERQAGPVEASHVQPLGSGQRRLHGSGARGRRLAAGLRRHGLSHGEARGLWDKIMRATYDYAEPGVIFIDRINQRNNLAYCETIRATNPAANSPCRPMAPAFWARSTWRLWSAIPSSRARGSTRRACASWCRTGRAHAGQRHRRLALSPPRATARGGRGQAPHRSGHHRPGRCADLLRQALWQRRGGRPGDGGQWMAVFRREAYLASPIAGPRKGGLSPVRQASLSGERDRSGAGPGRDRGHRARRHAQRDW